MITNEALACDIEHIRKYCTSALPSVMHGYYDEALKKIVKIAKLAARDQLQAHEPVTILSCLVKILFHYDEWLSSTDNACEWKRKRKSQTARETYRRLLRIYIPEKTIAVIESILNSIQDDNLWRYETFAYQTIHDLFDCGGSGLLILHAMYDRVESFHVNLNESRIIVRILYELLNVYNWPDTHETVVLLERMLNLFYASITDSEVMGDNDLRYAMFKKGLEVCIRNAIGRLSNDHLLVIIQHMCAWAVEEDTSDTVVLDFGSTLEYAAYTHRVMLYERSLTPKVFPLLVKMIASESRIVSLLGNRVAQYLIDRRQNKSAFNTPIIFFEGADFEVKMGECHKEDKLFIKLHREILHDSLLKSIANHSKSRMNLEATYCTICLIANEVPCGFTAAAIVCLAMNLQDLTLKEIKDHQEVACHVHATVIAIMSLLCWIHKAKVFYGYINKVMLERARWAPHLNPPIQSEYNFAVHHILWNKPELFFVDWEARYGLWKCFRLHDVQDTVDAPH
ncbi:hypothetical protein KM043_010581 [Ampulex compressa]|nr:hypothetical protein KM043_010581 [Ampulex compressa]